MRSMDLYKTWLSPLLNPQSHNPLPHCLFLLGGGQ